MNLQTILIISLVSLVVGFGSGWKVHSWKTDAEEKAAIEAAAIVQRSVSETLENKLQELKANERVIEREKIKIIDRPVYRNDCLDPDGLRIVNSAAGITAESPR